MQHPIPRDVEIARAAADAALAHGMLALAALRDGRVVWASDALLAMFQWSDDDLGTPLVASVAAADVARVAQALAGAATTRKRIAFRAERRDGTSFDAELDVTSVTLPEGADRLIAVADVTERRRIESRLSYLAFLDPTTGLPNRALFFDRLRDALVEAQTSGRPFAVMAADLDGFKAVNDALGHHAGDLLLAAVGSRLRDVVRTTDTVARIGGDEFAFLLPGVGKPDRVAIVASRAIRALAEPFVVDGKTVCIGVSIGIATFPDTGADIDTLFARADVAMYGCKRAGKNRYAFADGDTACAPVRLAFVTLDASHAMGESTLDAQHARLAEIINALGDDLKRGRGRDALLETLASLVESAREHFAYEEVVARDLGVASLDEHAGEHRRQLDDLLSLSITLDESSMALTMRFLAEWLLSHVGGHDREIARALGGSPASHRALRGHEHGHVERK